MREQGLAAPPVMYVPQDEEDYYMQTGQLPKALAATSAQADLTGIVFLKDRTMVLFRCTR